MRFKFVALGFLVVVLLGAMTGVGHASRQGGEEVIFSPASTPVLGDVNCGGNIPLFSANGITPPAGVTVVFACGHVTDDGLLNASVVLLMKSGVVMNDNGENESIRQKGTAYITVLEGTLNVTLLKNCADDPTCESTNLESKAELRTTGVDNATEVTPVAKGQTVTVGKGHSITLVNVTVTYEVTSDDVLLDGSGSYFLGPGEGCPSRCWQIP